MCTLTWCLKISSGSLVLRPGWPSPRSPSLVLSGWDGGVDLHPSSLLLWPSPRQHMSHRSPPPPPPPPPPQTPLPRPPPPPPQAGSRPPGRARRTSISAGTASVCPSSTCAMTMMTAVTTQTSWAAVRWGCNDFNNEIRTYGDSLVVFFLAI